MSITVNCNRCGNLTGKAPDPVVISVIQYKNINATHHHLNWKGDLCEPCLHTMIRCADPNNSCT